LDQRAVTRPIWGPWLKRQLIELWNLIKNSWLTFDRRTLGLSRLLLGFYLVMDLLRRSAQWEDMFSDKGIMPSYVILKNLHQSSHFSFLHGFTTAPELWALFAVIFVTFFCLFVGYKTKVAQVLSLVFVTSMNGRVLLIENGGYVVQNLLLLWMCFMPLGDRFSVDGLLASMRRKRERTAADLNDRSELAEPFRLAPFVSIVGLVICAQIMAVYYFNVIHKFGPGWKRDWTAVHYVMYVDRMVTPIIADVRDYIPFRVYQLMTFSVVVSESLIGFCTMLPQLVVFGFDVKLWLKRIGLILINFLHLGFGSTFVLGPFAWGLCVFSSLLISYEDWEVAARTMRREHRARTVVFDPDSGAALWLCRVVARMDRFGLIGFREARTADEKRRRISVVDQRDPMALVTTDHAALAQIIAALPVGPVFAWILRVPPVSNLFDALMNALRGRASRFFGLSVASPEGKAQSRARHRVKSVGRLVSELACLVMFVGAINQALVELWCTSKGYTAAITRLNERYQWDLKPQPDAMRTLTHKLRFLQGWFMFSPNPVMVDGTIAVDAVTVDGRHIDPFMYRPPDFDLIHAKSYGYNQIWSDYFNRIQADGAKAYRESMLDYMRRLPERTGNPNDALVSGEVWWITDRNPKPRTKNPWTPFGTNESYGQQQQLLFSFGATGGPVHAKSGS